MGGTPMRVRYDWFDVPDGSTRWEQRFSYDDGATWVANWFMTMTREPAD
jgi:hypothetical protein